MNTAFGIPFLFLYHYKALAIRVGYISIDLTFISHSRIHNVHSLIPASLTTYSTTAHLLNVTNQGKATGGIYSVLFILQLSREPTSLRRIFPLRRD